MELSLFSRDVVAMATAVALSHDMFDGALMLGVCDKIVPGLLIGALTFGHLPTVFVPAGPMPSGLPNGEKSRIRQLHAEGKVGREELLEAEAAVLPLAPAPAPSTAPRTPTSSWSRRWACTCPGASFVNPGTPLRRALTERGRARVASREGCAPIGEIVDERALVNGVVALLATGGSTNHTMHLVAIAAAAGHHAHLGRLRRPVARSCRCWPASTPTAPADINHFHAAGGDAVPDRRAARRRPHAPRRATPSRATASAATATSRTSTRRRAALAPAPRATRATTSVLRPVARRRSRPTAASACSTARSAAR